jgi:hypothetical protein
VGIKAAATISHEKMYRTGRPDRLGRRTPNTAAARVIRSTHKLHLELGVVSHKRLRFAKLAICCVIILFRAVGSSYFAPKMLVLVGVS